MKRKICAVLSAVLAMSMCFAGCGNEGKSTDTFYIGGIGPITGGAAMYGEAVKNGAQLAIDEINEAGGVKGYKLEFNFQDDTHDAETAVNAYGTLKDWGMQILVGTVTTTPCLAIVDKTYADNIFQITPSASATDVIVNDNVFQVCFTDPNQGSASATYISENAIAKKVAVIYDSSDVYSSGIYETFSKEADNLDIEIVAAEAFTSESKTDFTVQLSKAQSAGAELVFLPIYYNEAALILTQADQLGYDPIFFGCDGLDGVLGVEGFDTALAEDVMLLTPFAADAEDDKTQAFVTAYQEAFKDTPSQFAADGYDAIYAIKAALEKTDVTPEDSNEAICEALKTAMTEINIDGLTGDDEGMTWSATGEVSKAPKAVVIKNGSYTAY